MGLRKKCKKAVNIEIKKEARKEANKILKLTTKGKRLEFLHYHLKDQGNICCLVLDKAKEVLVEYGMMVQGKDDNFGNLTFK